MSKSPNTLTMDESAERLLLDRGVQGLVGKPVGEKLTLDLRVRRAGREHGLRLSPHLNHRPWPHHGD